MKSGNIETPEQYRNERTQISGDKVRNRASAKNTKRRTTLSGLEVDFDRLVSNIEKSIMADQHRGTVGITPQQLLVKSNPAMYAYERERELTRDLTNPREMYNLLSHNTKSTEDLTAKFKQEIARNIQAPGVFPKLSRSNTLNEIGRLHHRKADKLGRFQSASEILTPNKKLNVLVVTRNKTNLESFQTIIEDDKENLGDLNLPNITRIVANKVDAGVASAKNKRIHFGFPVLSAEQNAQKKTATTIVSHVDKCKEPESVAQHTVNLRSADPKIDKWFSDMPNEVFDKAQRAIMEDSIKDKLTKYQHKRNRKENFPAHVNVMHGTRLRKVPNTFLEVRVDSFGKYLKNEERMNKYKLQQKSILKLKMREMDELERNNKSREDINFSPGLRMPYRSYTTMTYKDKNNPTTEKQNQDKVDVKKDESGLKTFNVNEVLKRDIMSRERTHLNYYREFTEKQQISKSAHDTGPLHECSESERGMISKIRSAGSKGSKTADVANRNASGSERGIAKTSVVTIALENGSGVKTQKQLNNQNISSKAGETHTIDDERKDRNENTDADQTNKLKLEQDDSNTEEMEGTDETSKCVTKIPTAKSSRTTDSNRSTISSKQSPKPNKSVLNRFNKLEVFAEHGKASDAKMVRSSYHGHKLREHEPKEPVVPPSYKLDLKNYPQHFKNPIPDEQFVMNHEVRKQEPTVVFRFEPGEVFISRKSNTNRASERARIIYGKVLNKDEKVSARDTKNAKDSHSAHSLSTGLDGYKFEIGNFEQRALADSVPSDSVREHEHPNTRLSNPVDEELEYENRPDLETASTVTKTPQEFYMRRGKVVRDIAIETDILGSETDSLQGHFVEERPESNLSDYIIDNNDGESLDSDSEDDDRFQVNHVRKSTVKSRGTQSRVSARTFQST